MIFKALLRQISKSIKSSATGLLEKCVPTYHYNRSIEFAMTGRKFADEQVAAIEKTIEVNPNYLNWRILLLGKYGERQFQPNNSEGPRSRHIEWIVRNYPEHPIAGSPFAQLDSYNRDGNYKRIRDIWVEQTERSRTGAYLLTHLAISPRRQRTSRAVLA